MNGTERRKRRKGREREGTTRGKHNLQCEGFGFIFLQPSDKEKRVERKKDYIR